MTEAMALSLMAMTNSEPSARQHADQRLRQDDRAERLEPAHAEGERRLHLVAAHGGEAGAHRLAHIGAEMDAEPGDAGGDGD